MKLALADKRTKTIFGYWGTGMTVDEALDLIDFQIGDDEELIDKDGNGTGHYYEDIDFISDTEGYTEEIA